MISGTMPSGGGARSTAGSSASPRCTSGATSPERRIARERERLEAELGDAAGDNEPGRGAGASSELSEGSASGVGGGNPEQRNALARLVFESIEIEDDRVIAVVPQPDFAPFFVKRATG